MIRRSKPLDMPSERNDVWIDCLTPTGEDATLPIRSLMQLWLNALAIYACRQRTKLNNPTMLTISPILPQQPNGDL